jgi:uncharacterized cupin superfamily protein
MPSIRRKQSSMSKPASVIDSASVEKKAGSGYPQEFRKEVADRARARLGDLFGLTQFGVNVVTLPPGAWSSHRHWHETEDEFVYILDGEITLIDNAGEHRMTKGMCAGFKANNGNGHHLINKSDNPATYLEVGSRKDTDRVTYSDIDMKAEKDAGPWRFVRKDGRFF